jgi:pyruvoyl-dependent arginine decarboxylase (PvlArgDC)
MAQGTETLLAIIETTPQGKELATRLKLELAKGQASAGVLREAALIVETHVDNDAAKKAARLVLNSLPSQMNL